MLDYLNQIEVQNGIDGLSEIKKLILKSKKLLKINGKLIFEIGIKQLKFIMIFLNKTVFIQIKFVKIFILIQEL